MKIPATAARIAALTVKEWIQIRRDTRSLILSIIIPSMLVLLFGYALVFDVKHVKLAVVDLDRSPLSRQYLEKFTATEYLTLTRFLKDQREIGRLLDTGEIILGIVVPSGFEREVKRGRTAAVQVLIDGADSTSAMIAGGYVRALTYEFNAELHEGALRSRGIVSVKPPVDVQSRIWYNPELRSKNFIIPGTMGLILAVIAALITSLTVSREWERGTMETLITTPVRPHEVVIGKLVPYVLIGLFDVVCVLMVGYFVFDVPFRGSFLELCLVSVLFLVGTCSMGIFISSATRVQVLSVQLAIVTTYLPSFILSDFIFPVRNMPIIVWAITYVVPAKYMIAIIKGIALRGVGYSVMMVQIGFLALFSVLMLILSIRNFKTTLPST